MSSRTCRAIMASTNAGLLPSSISRRRLRSATSGRPSTTASTATNTLASPENETSAWTSSCEIARPAAYRASLSNSPSITLRLPPERSANSFKASGIISALFFTAAPRIHALSRSPRSSGNVLTVATDWAFLSILFDAESLPSTSARSVVGGIVGAYSHRTSHDEAPAA